MNEKGHDIWKAICTIEPFAKNMSRMSRVLWCYRRGLITDTELQTVSDWLARHQIEDFAQ